MDFKPFEKLLNLVYEQMPNILVLTGPFIDSESSFIKEGRVNAPPVELFMREYIGRIRMLTSRVSNLKVVIVPSVRDLIADPVLPQPPIPKELIGDTPNIILAPNPANLHVNGANIAISSSEVLLPLGMEEYFCGSGDRINRLCSHILQQASHYPLHPAPPGINIDYTMLSDMDISHAPHLYLCSSQLRYFGRSVDGTLFVNPGQFCRRQATGTAAQITLQASGNRVDFYQF